MDVTGGNGGVQGGVFGFGFCKSWWALSDGTNLLRVHRLDVFYWIILGITSSTLIY